MSIRIRTMIGIRMKLGLGLGLGLERRVGLDCGANVTVEDYGTFYRKRLTRGTRGTRTTSECGGRDITRAITTMTMMNTLVITGRITTWTWYDVHMVNGRQSCHLPSAI